MVPPLTKDNKPYAYVYMDGAFALVNGAKNRDMALKVLEFTATPDFGTIFSNITYNIPAVLGAKIPSEPLLIEVLEVSKKDASPYVYWVGSVFVTQKPSLYDDILAPGMQAMYAGKITPKELAKMAQDGISQWYKPLMKKK
jgi:raffinose/stachyose/melibiose transport system substrate-binding protein